MNLELLILFFMALGLDIKTFTITDILVRFMRFLPLLIEHGHLIELGAPNTGKSYISKRFNEIFELVKALSVAHYLALSIKIWMVIFVKKIKQS